MDEKQTADTKNICPKLLLPTNRLRPQQPQNPRGTFLILTQKL